MTERGIFMVLFFSIRSNIVSSSYTSIQGVEIQLPKDQAGGSAARPIISE